LKKQTILLALVLLSLSFTSCASVDAAFYATDRTFADFDLMKARGITFDENVTVENPFTEYDTSAEEEPNRTTDYISVMKVYDSLELYDSPGGMKNGTVLEKDTVVYLTETADSSWTRVSDTDQNELGYAKNAYSHVIGRNCSVYAELPIEYGKAKTNAGTTVDAYSHLVDVRKYLTAYESTEYDNTGVDLSQYDVKISMKLSTSDTSIGEPFYTKNLCMLQYDVLQKLMKAIDKFKADGYTVVIYDAYRPTSVQQRWFNVVRVHKWVADPSIGMGGVHDRGAAIDMSLIDTETGIELEMPTPMHTFTEASARSSTTMSAKARENMNYMLKIMTSCGFTYINSEWWHFQDVNTQYYLPTDHPIDEIPMTVVEN